jgi:hypothetical protein
MSDSPNLATDQTDKQFVMSSLWGNKAYARLYMLLKSSRLTR